MDETVAEYIRRSVLRMSRSEAVQMLRLWGFLSETQLQALNVHQNKETLSREVVRLCEENGATLQQAAELDIIYNYTYRNKRLWNVYQMSREEGEEDYYFELANFKRKFKRYLQSTLKNVTVSFKEYEDSAIWIRIAWETSYGKLNQYKPTFVVHHSQTPYVFISSTRMSSNIPFLRKALLFAASYSGISGMELRGRCLDSLRDIVFKRYTQSFQTHHLQSLQEINVMEKVDPRLILEDRKERERIHIANREAFGSGPQPKLEFAEFKLETTFRSEPEKGLLMDKEPFRCTIKFSSPHLLEALKSLTPGGMADAPLSPLLTSITHKAKNYFKIREKRGAHSQSLLTH